MVQNQIRDFMEIFESLNSAQRAAGGSTFGGSQLLNMSAFELLELLAPNGIRFSIHHGLMPHQQKIIDECTAINGRKDRAKAEDAYINQDRGMYRG